MGYGAIEMAAVINIKQLCIVLYLGLNTGSCTVCACVRACVRAWHACVVERAHARVCVSPLTAVERERERDRQTDRQTDRAPTRQV